VSHFFYHGGPRYCVCQEVQRSLFVWALVDPTEPDEERVFEVVGTGHPVDPVAPLERKFVGTSVGHPFVWHVFELVQPTTL